MHAVNHAVTIKPMIGAWRLKLRVGIVLYEHPRRSIGNSPITGRSYSVNWSWTGAYTPSKYDRKLVIAFSWFTPVHLNAFQDELNVSQRKYCGCWSIDAITTLSPAEKGNMMSAYVVGVSSSRFAKHPDRSFRQLAESRSASVC